MRQNIDNVKRNVENLKEKKTDELGKEIRVYIEKYIPEKEILLLDFVSQQHFEQFCLRKNVNPQQSENRTMLYIRNIRISKKAEPKEGFHYPIPEELFDQKHTFENSPINENGIMLEQITAFFITLRGDNDISFETSAASQRSILPEAGYFNWEEDVIKIIEDVKIKNEELKIIIRNVGQANWNEVYSNGSCKIIYDIGCSIYYDVNVVKNLINNTPLNHHPVLIISHWDIDHYLALVKFPKLDFNKFRNIIVPYRLPNKTSEKVLKLFPQNKVIRIPECSKKLIGRKISSKLIKSTDNLALFRGERSSDRNKSGLSLAVIGKYQSVILPADHTYYQVFRNMYTELPENIPLNLVTPHHGGKAGSITRALKDLMIMPGASITSTGKNNYGHPFEETKSQLDNHGFTWVRTDEGVKDPEIIL
ncbi:hypothetical protein B14911_03404 [Bacillus sp. NRRL B-14911]|uniref:Metallo-beta-lactamase domain-containing protein n=1 Tax=Bacillus infantis NRRL B-14911 TaxID=1367477 RepID=U5LF30_9BACI|nr:MULTISPECIES: hypothetical protein [Bacillus]AGX06474.1 hypothetical protein N288_23175 [Bacillus infantis NRRL B-14911]EAR68597.1 hypothetical protein B14911_03404 [Bacillus sp. NRRL B-14911]